MFPLGAALGDPKITTNNSNTTTPTTNQMRWALRLAKGELLLLF
jgi:hypothetical protein